MANKSKKKRPTLKVSIISSLIVLISLSNLGIIGLIYFYSQRISKDLIRNSMERVTTQVQRETTRYFSPAVKTIQYYKNMFESGILNPSCDLVHWQWLADDSGGHDKDGI